MSFGATQRANLSRGAARRGLHPAGLLGLRPLQLVAVLAILIAGLAAAGAAVLNEREGWRAAREVWAGRAAASVDDEVSAAGSVLNGRAHRG